MLPRNGCVIGLKKSEVAQRHLVIRLVAGIQQLDRVVFRRIEVALVEQRSVRYEPPRTRVIGRRHAVESLTNGYSDESARANAFADRLTTLYVQWPQSVIELIATAAAPENCSDTVAAGSLVSMYGLGTLYADSFAHFPVYVSVELWLLTSTGVSPLEKTCALDSPATMLSHPTYLLLVPTLVIMALSKATCCVVPACGLAIRLMECVPGARLSCQKSKPSGKFAGMVEA